MKTYFIFIALFLISFKCLQSRKNGDELCFPVIGDMGGLPRPPYRTVYQVRLAKLMAKVTERKRCKFVLGLGDNFYYEGVKNVQDPRFQLTFEQTYSDPSLQIPWYMIAGNHDHISNISAQIAYTKFSNRWKYPDYYYSVSHAIPGSPKFVDIIVIDTTMLCWHDKKSGAPLPEVQMKWLEEKLKNSKAHFLIVAGHHPIYSAGTHGNTRCLNEKIKPLLEKYDVTAYFSGHDHNIQHIKEDTSKVHYFVSGSGNFRDPSMSNIDNLPKKSLKAYLLQHGFLMVSINRRKMKIKAFGLGGKKAYKIARPLRLRMNKRVEESGG